MRSLCILFIGLMAIATEVSCASQTSEKTSEKTIGVWIAAPRHTSLFDSYTQLKSGIETLSDRGINTLFLCAWADHKTAFESEVLLSHSNYNHIKETSLFQNTNYNGPSGDPVRDLIDLAHSKNMKVLFWFEYGFMARWGTEPTQENDPLLAKQPHWKGLGNDGLGTNYNGTDYYYNAYHPEVQQFILDLIDESITRYPDIDGIQGDDRLPASPANSGYDAWTVSQYQVSHEGQSPPEDFRDKEWYAWRINLLNNFANRMYQSIKSKGNYTVAFSPNIYPWAYDNLMQDWPSWLRQGNVELLNVQCYRRTFKDYKIAVDEMLSYSDGLLDRSRVSPGIILGIASQKMANPESLDSILDYNTQLKLGGQSYFYEKWLVADTSFAKTMTRHHLNTPTQEH